MALIFLLELLVLVLVAGFLIFSRLRCPLLEPEEARYAEIPREMSVYDSWLMPVLQGQPYYHKPPLLYWFVMVSYRLFGAKDWAARLVPCLAAFSVVLVTFFWGRRTAGHRAAWYGALILCLSGRFIYLGRMLTLESLLCLWVVGSWAAAHIALTGTKVRWAWWLGSACLCGLGVLTKGPVALVLVALPVLGMRFIDPRLPKLRPRSLLFFLIVVMAVAGPWYVALAVHDPASFRDFFWTHNVVRYVSPLDHEEPAWFYFPGLLLGMLPWTLLLLPMAKFMVRRSPAAAARRSPSLGVFILTALTTLAFFSLSGCKRAGYILPAIPPLALSLGYYLDRTIPTKLFWNRSIGSKRGFSLASWATMLVLVLALGANLAGLYSGLAKPQLGIGLALAAIGGLIALWFTGRSQAVAFRWALCAGTTFVFLLAGINMLLPSYNRKFSLRNQIRNLADPSQINTMPVLCYPHRWDSVSFYLDRDDVSRYSSDQLAEMMADLQTRPQTMVFIKTDHFLREFLHNLPDSLEFEPKGHPGFVTGGIVRHASKTLANTCHGQQTFLAPKHRSP